MRGLRDVGKGTVSREFQSPDVIEKAAIEAALNKCRALAAQIESELRNKEQLVDKASLAELFAALERAADVLRQKRRPPVHKSRR
jgi:glutathione S-transferase